jgi:hypothetical protein
MLIDPLNTKLPSRPVIEHPQPIGNNGKGGRK